MNAVATLPALRLTIGDQPLSGPALTALTVIRVQQRLSVPAQCELVFVDPGEALPVSRIAPGTRLRVALERDDQTLFAGEVTATEMACGPGRTRELRVRGYDSLHRLRKRGEVRAWIGLSAADLARELTGDLGLTIEADEPGPRWPYFIQSRQSDLDLLADRAESAGLYLVQGEDRLALVTLAGTGEPISLTLGESLIEAEVELNADRVCDQVVATGWDVTRSVASRGTATRARAGHELSALVVAADVGAAAERRLEDRAVLDADQADGLAQAELDRRAAGVAVLRGIAAGDARLSPGVRVRVSGLDRTLDGPFVLTSVVHTIDPERGFLSTLSSEPPPARPVRSGAAVVLGVVIGVDDPDGRGRVRVRLPSYEDVETDWIQVAALGAGANKGLVILPDVGDSVLVLLAQEDPARGLVLAGLYGEAGAPDPGVEAGAVRRFLLQTSGGHRLRLDDGARSLTVADGAGSTLELSASAVHLRAAVPLTIEAPGQPIVIRGKTIDFEKG
jgi:uncharacterized protein involved in type VI secretion and phage assembly